MEENNEATASGPVCKKDYYHHHGPFKFAILLIGGFIIMGGFFCLGRISARSRVIDRGFVRNAPAMMGQFGGQVRKGMNQGRAALSHGTSGSITAINGNKITVKDSSGKEFTVNISDTTSIITDTNVAALSDLKVGQNVLVRGSSNSSGEINAVFINIQS